MRVSGSNPAGGANFSSDSGDNAAWLAITQQMSQYLNKNPPDYASLKALAIAMYPLLSHTNDPSLKMDISKIIEDLKSSHNFGRLSVDIWQMQKDFKSAGTITVQDPQKNMAGALNEFLAIAGMGDTIDGSGILNTLENLGKTLLPQNKDSQDALDLIQQAASSWNSNQAVSLEDIESAIVTLHPV